MELSQAGMKETEEQAMALAAKAAEKAKEEAEKKGKRHKRAAFAQRGKDSNVSHLAQSFRPHQGRRPHQSRRPQQGRRDHKRTQAVTAAHRGYLYVYCLIFA